MSSASSSDVEFEIGHVLFIDIVGYSKLLLHEQSEQIQKLREIVRSTEQFRTAEVEGKLLRLPTGDGGALVFRTSPEAPVKCALETSTALKAHPELRVRMGIHSGPVNEITDLNEQANIAGAGINVAQRVMDCGDAGHILLSRHIAEDLEHSARWRPYLHELGECEVKHGLRIGVVNFYGDEIGNPKIPKELQVFQKHRARMRWTAISTALLLFIGVVVGFVILSKRSAESITTVPAKSIAVLPFENLSGNPENAYFTEGIQEEILTRLAKIADLKVISRTSTHHFKSSPDNLPQIAKQLGVANILEGSVQRAADQVHVNVQLIKAATDAHLWAEAYDRKLTDIFAAEADIAKTIADTLQAKLSGAEEKAIAKRPTENPEAHELYLKGRFFWNKRTGADLRTAIDYFNQALGKDPSYALAFAGLSDSYDLLPWYGAASPADSFPQAKAAANKALELDDMLAEAHTSLGSVLCDYDFDFQQSIKEFDRAIELNPNYATAHHWYADGPLLASGRFDRAIAEGKRAVELDPLSLVINTSLGIDYFLAHRYYEAIAQLRKTIEMDPRFYYAHWALGEVWQLKGQLNDAITEYRRAVELNDDPFVLALLGQAYARAGQREEAQKILARLGEEAKLRYVHAYSFALMYLGLGDKERAIDEMERAYRERAGSDVWQVKFDPMIDDLRGQPRFEALVQKIFAAKR
jgi:TolB-like protein/Tfp pilus assembly protein PilF